ncbi:hypothetical protein SPAN111604_01145 [Sphingomonas antarctica]
MNRYNPIPVTPASEPGSSFFSTLREVEAGPRIKSGVTKNFIAPESSCARR